MEEKKWLSPAIRDFMRNEVCLIVEPSQTFSASIQHCLNDLNLSLEQVITARRFEDAKRIIHERKPKVVITEYEVESKFGLSLLELQGLYHNELERISIIVTRNTSDSTVAEAAEEEIDAYILKPFSPDTFRQKFLEILEKKVTPSEYARKIHRGKMLFAAQDLEGALGEFLTSKRLDRKPTLACFYAGQTFQFQGEFLKALAEFREGRTYQPLHYKCLMAEFDELVLREDYKEAYRLIPLIKANYPVTAQRLGQMFIAAVFTQHFYEMSDYFQLFLKLEARTPQLTQLASLALLTTGRYFLSKKDLAQACECFEMGALATAREMGYLEKVIHELLVFGAVKEAEGFFGKIQPHEIGTPEYARLSFKVDRFLLNQEQVIAKGRKIVSAGQATPEIYEVLVKILATAGKEPMAESIISKAMESHPELRTSLYKILTDYLPKY
jgi:DNA-binding NarL/FixJ family response regulator